MFKHKKNRWLYPLSFLLPLLILASIAFDLSIAPFGDRTLLTSDLSNQYTMWFAYFQDFFFGKANLHYSFSFGMGDASAALIGYYLTSPFNFLFLLVPKEQFDVMAGIVITLKISCASSAFLFYLQNTYKKAEFKQLAFALSYAFSSYIGVYMTNIMWMDAMIFFPLVIFGLQRLIDKKKGVFYTLMLFSVITTNYYLGYMVCIFIVFYYIYWTMKQTEFTTIKEYFIRTKQEIILFIGYSFFGGLLSSFVLVPTIIGMMDTDKTAVSLTTFLPYPHFLFDFFLQFGLENSSMRTVLSHLPLIYTGSLVMILTTAYFFLPFEKKEKRLKIYLLVVLFLSFWIQTFNAFWHMFQTAAGFPYRNSFMMSFVFLFLAYEALEKQEFLSRKLLLRICLSLIGLLCVGYLYAKFLYTLVPALSQIQPSSRLFLFSVLFYAINALLLINRKKQWAFIGLFLFLMTDASTNLYQITSVLPFNSSSAFSKRYDALHGITSQLKESKELETFSRLRTENQTIQLEPNYNFSVLYDFYGIASYTSTLNNQLRTTLQNMGIFSKNPRRLTSFGTTPFTDYLLNVNDKITDRPLNEQQPIFEKGDFFSYQINPQTSNIAYFLPNGLVDSELDSLAPFENQNKLVQAILDNENPLFSNQSFTQQENGDFQLTADKDGVLYIYVNYDWTLPILRINNELLPLNFPATPRTLIRLGDVKEGEQVDLAFAKQSKHLAKHTRFAIMNEQVLQQTIQKMYESQLEIAYTQKMNTFSALLTSDDGNRDLFLSIPYHRNWRVRFDGRPGTITPALSQTFMSIKIPDDASKMELYFVPVSFYLGTMMSSIGVAGLPVFAFIQRKKARAY